MSPATACLLRVVTLPEQLQQKNDDITVKYMNHYDYGKLLVRVHNRITRRFAYMHVYLTN